MVENCKYCKEPICAGLDEMLLNKIQKLASTKLQFNYIKKNNIKNTSIDTCDDCFKNCKVK